MTYAVAFVFLLVAVADFMLPKPRKEKLRDYFIALYVFLADNTAQSLVAEICKILSNTLSALGPRWYSRGKICAVLLATVPAYVFVFVLTNITASSHLDSLSTVEILREVLRDKTIGLTILEKYGMGVSDAHAEIYNYLHDLSRLNERQIRHWYKTTILSHSAVSGALHFIWCIISTLVSLAVTFHLLRYVSRSERGSAFRLFLAAGGDLAAASLVLFISYVTMLALVSSQLAGPMVDNLPKTSFANVWTNVFFHDFNHMLDGAAQRVRWLWESFAMIYQGEISKVSFAEANSNWVVVYSLLPTFLYLTICLGGLVFWLVRPVFLRLSVWIVDHEKHPIGFLAAFLGLILAASKLFKG